ncbi:MAG: TonB-dependent receptor domain-containing protein, partial [Pyrinomonadaceae bacterium]
FSAYGQDTWKVTPRLTLTYGLRWEVNPPPSESTGNHPAVTSGLENPATITLAPFGTPLYKTTYNNFAPRVGAAYQLSQKQGRETVLRGGFGLFYDIGSGAAANAFSRFPYVSSKDLFGVPFPLSSSDAAAPPFSLDPPFDIVAIDSRLKLPRTYQWNASLEQFLGAHQTVSASYVAAVGRRLLRQEQLLSPNPDFTLIDITRNGATSDYHAMQIQFDRRLSRGLQALASYTWSHSIDIASSDTVMNTATGFNDPNIDRGSSDFDVRHAFNAAVTYNLPNPKLNGVVNAILRNWTFDTIITARSATPVDLIGGINFTGFFSFVRPDLVAGEPLNINDPLAPGGRRFNPTAFAPPPT